MITVSAEALIAFLMLVAGLMGWMTKIAVDLSQIKALMKRVDRNSDRLSDHHDRLRTLELQGQPNQ